MLGLIHEVALQDEKLFRAKISDFGLSAHMTAGQTSVSISQGTEAYLPKEVFQNLAITEASDIYALGLLMWEIFYGIFWFIVWDAEKRRKKCDPLPLPAPVPLTCLPPSRHSHLRTETVEVACVA